MILYEYNEEKHIRSEKEISWQEGKAEGIIEGKVEGKAEGQVQQLFRTICRKLRKNRSLLQIIDDTDEDLQIIEPLYNFALNFAPDFDEERVCESWFRTNSKE